LETVSQVAPYLPVPAFIVSLVSIWIAYKSFQRTKVFQEYEYAPRLQLNEEEGVAFASQTLVHLPAIRYKADIENRGSKPVEIASIYLDYGARDDPDKRMKYSVAGKMYLSAGQKYEIDVQRSWNDIADMKERFNIDQAMFFLRVSFYRPNGNLEESVRSLGGYDDSTTVFVPQRSTTLS
jgi:hypothetical protein